MASRYKSLLKDTLIFGLGNFGTKLILFLMVPLYTNYMSDAEFGIADLVFTIAQLMAPFISVVIFDAVIRFGLSQNEKRENVLLVGVVVWGMSVILGLLLTPIIGLYRTMNEWKWYLYIYVISSIADSIGYCYLKAKGKNKLYALLSVIQTALMASLNVYFLVYRSMGIRGYLLAYIISEISVDICLFFAADVGLDLKKAQFDRDLFKRMVLFSSPLILNNVSWWVIQSSDKVMVEAMISAAALGIYTAAAKIPALINVMVTIFQQAWGISAVREFESSNDREYYSTVLRYLFLFISGACIVFVAFMKVFMTHYVGKDFHEAWHYVPLLLVSAVFAGIAGYFGSMYSALKKSVNNMLSTATAAFVNIVVNFILIPVMGIWGAVIGTLAAYLTIAFARLFDVKRFVTIDIRWRIFLPTLLILIVQAALVSIDYHVYLVSALAAAAYLALNFSDLATLVKQIKAHISP
ncbi:MAG: polysaccharide biosynthesis C-terminal domain-containing protein [Oscillospiraceae bacterium]|nr:polysaccharide biosynthesis C-terminal domain-containing protein [Oscillospiraceae bacterium]